MVDKEKLDEFLKILEIELLDYQKDILIKMLNDPDRKKKAIILARGSGYSVYRHLAIMFRAFLESCDKAKTISEINEEIKNGIRNTPNLAPTLSGKPIPLQPDKRLWNTILIDEPTEVEIPWPKENPFIQRRNK